MDLVDGLKAFVATAQTGSFTEAAERLGVSNRLTSKYVAELETRIGARLLQRTTRKVGLTPAGEILLARVPAVLEEIDDLLNVISEDSKGLSGPIRIAAPVTFGEIYIKGLLSRFSRLHPEVEIDLRLNDANVDLARDGIDLAFRIGTPENMSYKVRKLGVVKDCVVASPSYLSKNIAPKTPRDLINHVCIADTNRSNPTRWVFYKGNKELVINTSRRFLVNSARVSRDWATEGCGIALCPDFVLAREIADGQLVKLLEKYSTRTYPFNAIYLEGRVLPHRVRALIDFAVEDNSFNKK